MPFLVQIKMKQSHRMMVTRDKGGLGEDEGIKRAKHIVTEGN